MTRRRVVVLSSAIAIFAMALVVVIALVAITQTTFGRDRVRRLVLSQIASRIEGTMYVGKIGGGLLTGVTIDSLEIRGRDGSLLVATGPVTVSYDPRDFIDRRILLQYLSVERPVVHLREYRDGDWNYRRIFPRGKPSATRQERGFGDYVIIDSMDVRDGLVQVTYPWTPADSLRGARRDSAIAFNLARTDAEIRRAGEQFTRTLRWTGVTGSSSHVRLANPDSAGQWITLSRLSAEEFDPPFSFRNVRGTIRLLKDSLWLDIPHLELPGSVARGKGKVVWGSHLPVRYAVDIVSDSVALADVAWVHPTLPTTGGGRMKLSIRNQSDLRIIDYALTELDVRTTASRLLGSMTFGVGGPVLIVKDLDLEAAPVDFRLIHHLNGEPLPVDWAGTLTGRVQGRGGPLNRFRVDDARLTFRDAHVSGAESRLVASGELDILFPALTTFRGFDVDVAQLDLRTLQYLFPEMPRLGGTVAGTATLDSIWVDVRFRGADLVHSDGPGETSRFTGDGRVTLGDEFLAYDLHLQAERLAFTTMARSFERLPLRGTYQGPLRVLGTVEDLALVTTLTGPAGTIAVDGRFDVYPSRYAARGAGSVSGLDLRALLGREDAPSSDVTARFTMDLEGDSLADVAGRLGIDLERSLVDGLRIYPSRGRFRFADRHVLVDTLSIESAAATLSAAGAVSLEAGRPATLEFSVTADSLGGLRRWLRIPTRPLEPTIAVAHLGPGSLAALDGASRAADALGGFLQMSGRLHGSLDRLDADGTIAGRDLLVRKHRARSLTGGYSLTDVLAEPRGSAWVRLDSILAGELALLTASADLRLTDPRHGRFSASAVSINAPRFHVAGDVAMEGDTATLLVDSLTIEPGNNGSWRLTSPARVVTHPAGLTIDSLALRNTTAGVVTIRASLPRDEPVDVRITADSLSLAEVGLLAQSPVELGGRATLDWKITGRRAEPVMQTTAVLSDARVGDVRLEYVNLRGRYAGRQLDAALNLYRLGQPALTGTAVLPLDLSLDGVERRLLDEPLRGTIMADSVDLALLETFSPSLHGASGRLSTQLELGGTWRRPTLTGRVRIANGALGLANLGIRLERIHADVGLAGDSIDIRRLSAWSRRENGERGDTASLTGHIKFGSYENPSFDLRLFARDFHIIEKRGVASLDVSSGLRLAGTWRGASLTGGVTLERGQIYIPELVQKRAIDLSDPELYDVVDTSVFAVAPLLPDVPSAFVQNLSLQGVRIAIGPEVWLRSTEARIQLGGAVNVTSSRQITYEKFARPDTAVRLALEGSLNADRGVYRLNLGPVQRDFQVDRGKVVFYGEAALNPALDISAVHTVRQYNKQDVRIRVNIGGTLNQPELTLASDEGLPISQSDLLSYLVTGAPSFSLGNAAASQTAASVILPSVGSLLGGLLSGAVDLDLVQVQTAATDVANGGSLTDTGREFLSGTTLGVGRQFGNRTFVIANAGLCQIVKQSDATEGNLLNSLGLKIEHRFNHGFSVEAGVEPASRHLMCNANSSGARGTVETPRQLGIDLFRAWTF